MNSAVGCFHNTLLTIVLDVFNSDLGSNILPQLQILFSISENCYFRVTANGKLSDSG